MKKISFFEHLFTTAIDKLLSVVQWFSVKAGANSFLAALSKKRSKIVEFSCWMIFMFTFGLSFIFLFKQSLLLTIVFAIGFGCLVIAYGFPRVRELMMDSLPFRWIVQLLDPNK